MQITRSNMRLRRCVCVPGSNWYLYRGTAIAGMCAREPATTKSFPTRPWVGCRPGMGETAPPEIKDGKRR
eukprot:297747-Chlamydomonas_euryale.AAC.1